MATARPATVPPRLRVVAGGAQEGDSGLIGDELLVEALRRGDGHKAAMLYDRLLRVVDGALVRILGRREQDHDDLVQSVFEQIVLSLTKGRFDGACSLRAWAAAVACNVGLNALRSRVRERNVVDRARDPDVEAGRAGAPMDVERQVGARGELSRVLAELAAMRPDKATAVLLHDVFGHDLTEIAVLTGASVAAAQSRLVRGRKELHDRLRKAELDLCLPRKS